MSKRGVSRRAMLGVGLIVPATGCTPILDNISSQFSSLFGSSSKPRYTLTPRGDRMVRWLQNGGHDNMMAPEAFALMGITNQGRDIPVKQLADEDNSGRYVVSLVNIRGVHDLVFHSRQGEVLVFHHTDTAFARFESIRYPRNGKPTVITDSVFADSDLQKQLAFWFDRMPGR